MFFKLILRTLTFRVLSTTGLVASVFKKNNQQNQVGWITIGANSSDYEQKSHWDDMINAKNKEIKQWHTLLEDDNM